MKILYCNKYNFPFSGTEVYLLELMRMMRAHGQETALFSMAHSQGLPSKYDEHMAPVVDFKDSRAGWMKQAKLAGHAIYSTKARAKIREMALAFRPDVAHVRNIYHHLSPSILWELKAQRIPIIYHLNDFKLLCPTYNLVSHGQPCEACSGGKFRNVIARGCYEGRRGSAVVLAAEAYFHRWMHTYDKCIDKFIAPSNFVKQKLVENGFDGRKITVIPHFQQLPECIASATRSDAAILYFGRLSKEKGVADLIRAVSMIPNIKLEIAGDGPQRQQLQNLASESGAANIRFLGHISGAALEDAISSCLFTVLPSVAYETLGKSILESYAWARPVIATDRGSRREFVNHGSTGLLYEPGNVNALTEAISYLIDHPQLAAEMGAKGRSFVKTNHSPETHYEFMKTLYEEMVCARELKSRENRIGHRRPRVAFIGGRGVGSKYSGIESYYEQVGPRLTKLGCDLTVYCRNYFTPELAIYEGMRVVRFPTLRLKHLETVLHTFLSTGHAMFSDFDIVHYHAQGPALFSYLPRLVGKKTVVTVQGLDWQRKKWGAFAAFVLRLGEWASARLPNRTVVVSKVLRERYRDLYGVDAVYVPNGTIIRGRNQPANILQWGLQPENYILYLGRFSPEKNCHLLIEAYERIKTSTKLVLAGGSSHTDRYAAELRKHKSDDVVFIDWVSGDTLNELLSNAGLFVLPSDLEGLSLALLDAMGAGVCVLTSNIPENREVVDGVGYTFKAGDVEDLARMLTLLCADCETRRRSGESARERVRQQYLWPGVAREMADIYHDLIGQSHPPSSASGPEVPYKTRAA